MTDMQNASVTPEGSNGMSTKSVFQSKTFWLGVFTTLLPYVAQVPATAPFAEWARANPEFTSAAIGGLIIGFRFITDKGVHFLK